MKVEDEEFPPITRAYLYGRRDADETYRAIAESTRIPRNTVKTTYYNGKVQVKYKPGARPQKTSVRADGLIVRLALVWG